MATKVSNNFAITKKPVSGNAATPPKLDKVMFFSSEMREEARRKIELQNLKQQQAQDELARAQKQAEAERQKKIEVAVNSRVIKAQGLLVKTVLSSEKAEQEAEERALQVKRNLEEMERAKNNKLFAEEAEKKYQAELDARNRIEMERERERVRLSKKEGKEAEQARARAERMAALAEAERIAEEKGRTMQEIKMLIASVDKALALGLDMPTYNPKEIWNLDDLARAELKTLIDEYLSKMPAEQKKTRAFGFGQPSANSPLKKLSVADRFLADEEVGKAPQSMPTFQVEEPPPPPVVFKSQPSVKVVEKVVELPEPTPIPSPPPQKEGIPIPADLVDAHEQVEEAFRLLSIGEHTEDVIAIEILSVVSQQGHPDAQNALGFCHQIGRGVPLNLKMAVSLYEKAVAQGHVKAEYNLGLCYFNGVGCPVRKKEGIELLLKSAEEGYPDSQCYIGVCYAEGKGVAKNEIKAYEMFLLAAEQEHPDAVYQLAKFTEKGKGCKKDPKLAVTIMATAAELGQEDAIAWMKKHSKN